MTADFITEILPALLMFVALIYAVAQLVKDNSIMDIAWGMGFILIASLAIYYDQYPGYKARVIMFCTALWGLRLSIFLAVRNIGKPEDYRYAAWRKAWGKHAWWRAFLQVFLLQGTIMYVVSLVLQGGIFSDTQSLLWYNYLGLAIFLFGFFFEAIGDQQMKAFKSDASNKGKVMNTGLWRYTRHPNYFGEALIWWGLFLLAWPSAIGLLSLVSPVLMTFLLLKVSGVAMLERKYSDNPAYRKYQQETSSFIPWKPKVS